MSIYISNVHLPLTQQFHFSHFYNFHSVYFLRRSKFHSVYFLCSSTHPSVDGFCVSVFVCVCVLCSVCNSSFSGKWLNKLQNILGYYREYSAAVRKKEVCLYLLTTVPTYIQQEMQCCILHHYLKNKTKQETVHYAGMGQRVGALEDEHQIVKCGYLSHVGFVKRGQSLFTLYASVIKRFVKMRHTQSRCL